MSKIIFVTGGARSGKSSFAQEFAEKERKETAFIATSQALDKEMKKRIKAHKSSRPRHWKTFEEPVKLSPLLAKAIKKYPVVIIDCLTLLACNLMMEKKTPKEIREEADSIIRAAKEGNSKIIIVSNEVGLGIVPDNKLARDFRDLLGSINQKMAKKAEEVYFMVSGIAWRIR